MYQQPAFFYQSFEDDVKPSWDGTAREWFYPTDGYSWKVRFSPNQPGTWEYKIVALDAGGTAESGVYSFTVVPSASKGFIKVSEADPRYFDFGNGQIFSSPGLNAGARLDDPVAGNEPLYSELRENDINFVRSWISGIYGSAWLEWLGGRNIYDGYLPRSGLLPFHDPVRKRDVLALYLDYDRDGDAGWFDACRFQFWNDPEAVKPNTAYKLEITYWGDRIEGPRDPSHPSYGLVGKIGGQWFANCYEPGTSEVVTNYGGNTADWGTLTGVWSSGDNNFLPRIYIGLENVAQGGAYIKSISLREDLGNGRYGPEILAEPSLEYEFYIPEQSAYAMDKVVELAETYGLYLKLVVMDKSDEIYSKLDDDGTWVVGGEPDNEDGFYGLGRPVNKTRWLQQAWWRYLQARWGYSPNIHSWELTNEGDPFLVPHWEMADEFGKFMHCRVFGVPVSPDDGADCTFEHPNSHLVTTSFWHSFPGYAASTDQGFWGGPKYPNVDYADVHAYISTSYAPLEEKVAMEDDSAYYHTWHSQDLRGWQFDFPIVRGEAGMDQHDAQCQDCLGIEKDVEGVWAHNYLWSTLHSGALYELDWWWGGEHGHIVKPGAYSHLHIYKAISDFLKDIPLSNGHYEDLAAMVSDDRLRAWGQKDLANGQAHLWIQNKAHTWRNVVDGVSIPATSGSVTLPGFRPGATYIVKWWDTNTGQPASTETLLSQSDGSLKLEIVGLETDVAAKISRGSSG